MEKNLLMSILITSVVFGLVLMFTYSTFASQNSCSQKSVVPDTRDCDSSH